MKKIIITLALSLATAACGTHVTAPKGTNALSGGFENPPTCSVATSPGAKCP
jgi:hypothetical protein